MKITVRKLKQLVREVTTLADDGERHVLDDGGEALMHAVSDLKLALRNALTVFVDNQPPNQHGDAEAVAAKFDDKLEALVDWAFNEV